MTSWNDPPADLRLSSGHVDVWRISTALNEERAANFGSVLSPDQQARAKRMRVRDKRRQYIIAQGLTRILIGKVVDADPESLEFSRGPKGKPYLGGRFADAGIQFNMTHTSNMALIALTLKREIGIDIERIRHNLQWEKLVRRYFSPLEHYHYSKLPESVRLRAFFTCWTRKEAVLKAIGTGLGGGLGSFDVSVDPDAPPALLGDRWQGRFHGDWTITQLDPGEGYVATLVTERDGFEVRCWEADEYAGGRS
ncbi:MAG TPA: 4'-phosphopantetheinyl transferase superfamily protein [Gammaproteobacteria bacterium]|nr:4'-phosphopantetheinyl transferase superfamily protein [Gammaproteobacteria bacterium]